MLDPFTPGIAARTAHERYLAEYARLGKAIVTAMEEMQDHQTAGRMFESECGRVLVNRLCAKRAALTY